MPKKKQGHSRGGRKRRGPIPPEIAAKLRALRVFRDKAGYSQLGLAKAVGISREQLIKIEKGISMPQLDQLWKIEKELRQKIPNLEGLIPLPEAEDVALKISEVMKKDPDRAKHLLFDIDQHYKAALDAAKKENPGPTKTGTR